MVLVAAAGRGACFLQSQLSDVVHDRVSLHAAGPSQADVQPTHSFIHCSAFKLLQQALSVRRCAEAMTS